MLREPPGVAARFPDPDVRYATPSLREGRADFASHAEVLAFLEGLARESRHLKVETIGTSQRGLVVPLAVLAANGRFVERYVVTAESGGQRQDVRGAIDDADEKIRVLQVSTRRASEIVAPGTRLLDLENSGLRRVISRPAPPLLERR
jgi:hypothetical protein